MHFGFHSFLSSQSFKDSHGSTQYWVQVINPVLCYFHEIQTCIFIRLDTPVCSLQIIGCFESQTGKGLPSNVEDGGDEAMLSGWDRTGDADMPRTSVKLSTDRAAAAAAVHKS